MAIFDTDDIYKKSFNDVEKNIFQDYLLALPKTQYIQFFFENKIILIFMAEIITLFHNNINR